MRKKDPNLALSPELKQELAVAFLAEPNAGIRLAEMHMRSLFKRREKPYDALMGLQGSPDPNDIPPALIAQISSDLSHLVPQYLKAVERGNPHKLKDVFDRGFPVNFRNPVTGNTALHDLAAGGARPALRVLVSRKGVNYLLRDGRGRLASQLALVFGHDAAIARLLAIKERRQAELEGVTLRYRAP